MTSHDAPSQRILVCPFCGQAEPTVKLTDSAELDDDDRDSSNMIMHTVVCDASRYGERKENGCGAMGGFDTTPEKAIARWNTRPESVSSEIEAHSGFVYHDQGEEAEIAAASKLSQPAAEGTPRCDEFGAIPLPDCLNGSRVTPEQHAALCDVLQGWGALARTLERELAEAKENYSALVRINQEIRWELEAAESRLSRLSALEADAQIALALVQRINTWMGEGRSHAERRPIDLMPLGLANDIHLLATSARTGVPNDR